MKQKNFSSRCMAFMTDLIVTLIPMLIWDLIIFLVIAGFLPSSLMAFANKYLIYVVAASFALTTPAIVYIYGKTLGQESFDLRIMNANGKNASLAQKMLREFLGGMLLLGGYFIFHGLGSIVYILLNLIVILVDKKGRGIVDFVCQTQAVSVVLDKESNKKKPEEEGEEPFYELQKGKFFYHYDLHVHSRHSVNGTDTVEELFQKAKALGVEVLSVTDQYSVKANFEAEVLSKPYGLRYIPGIEMNCTYKGYPLTILGYSVHYKEPIFIELENEHLKMQRTVSAQRIEKFKNASGIDLNFSKLVNQTVSGIVTSEMIVEEVLSNPLYSELEVLKTYIEDKENGYQRLYMDYFGKGKPCDISEPLPELEEVLETISKSGGMSVLAYPKKSCGDDLSLLKEIMEKGIDGLEVFSPYHDETDIKNYLKLASDVNCFVSCGSDYFGDNELMIQLGDSKAGDKYEKLLSILVERCLKKVEK